MSEKMHWRAYEETCAGLGLPAHFDLVALTGGVINGAVLPVQLLGALGAAMATLARHYEADGLGCESRPHRVVYALRTFWSKQ